MSGIYNPASEGWAHLRGDTWFYPPGPKDCDAYLKAGRDFRYHLSIGESSIMVNRLDMYVGSEYQPLIEIKHRPSTEVMRKLLSEMGIK